MMTIMRIAAHGNGKVGTAAGMDDWGESGASGQQTKSGDWEAGKKRYEEEFPQKPPAFKGETYTTASQASATQESVCKLQVLKLPK
jgi:hypothetical protein